ncbi:spore maturation protein [Lachnoclostridium sp. MSJ-17]|uniref:spore maturation protein n=1 Tax=Lachnoclostridium sp. MSJ-17 TaxID=2841516 RepID=UPI001C120633|nr:nucleoside recognition domain-containing protein [Lachnoclostridium sp. MSJ-17]MBU5461880.1 spore maturation protein [Lachnoclostridium sp. MSJ-17]
MELVMPVFACVIVLFGLIRRVRVLDVFMTGAKEGIRTLYNIAPTIIGLMFAVSLLKSSGAVDVICSLIAPAAQKLGFPPEIVPMAMLRPVSGSGATALLLSVFTDCGPDSFAGRVASVLAGSSETTFYATAMYFGSVNIKNTRHTLPAALAADFTALVMSAATVKMFFY